MLSLRRCLPWSVVALLTLFAGVFSAQPARAESTGEAVCIGGEQDAESASLAICHQAFCSEVSDCWQACSSALTAACVDNACEYTYRTGGGGGGGPFCHQQFCFEDSQCVCRDAQGFCGADNTCYY
ncbi:MULTISPECIES: hypothetical protein [Myxococcus]|uniref:hypothetical protein n=1 Tax=Myxococcus TaxID=32 RepID=UPI0013D25EEF|nr:MULTISPECIES: hypothetical protein [Myxococcus]NVJ24339.1 hypothetical protein [Myxococcus sp. AM011]